jgi:hypothetical protein
MLDRKISINVNGEIWQTLEYPRLPSGRFRWEMTAHADIDPDHRGMSNDGLFEASISGYVYWMTRRQGGCLDMFQMFLFVSLDLPECSVSRYAVPALWIFGDFEGSSGQSTQFSFNSFCSGIVALV